MALILDHAKLRALKLFAEENIISYEEALKIARNEGTCAGDRQGYTLMIPVKYKLVFSIEWTPTSDWKRKVKLRRMSISVVGQHDRMWVNRASIEEIMKQLGFKATSLKDDDLIVSCSSSPERPITFVNEIIEEIGRAHV